MNTFQESCLRLSVMILLKILKPLKISTFIKYSIINTSMYPKNLYFYIQFIKHLQQFLSLTEQQLPIIIAIVCPISLGIRFAEYKSKAIKENKCTFKFLNNMNVTGCVETQLQGILQLQECFSLLTQLLGPFGTRGDFSVYHHIQINKAGMQKEGIHYKVLVSAPLQRNSKHLHMTSLFLILKEKLFTLTFKHTCVNYNTKNEVCFLK